MEGEVLGELREPEVRDLGAAVVQEDVGDLEIAVDHVLLGEVEEPLEDVADDGLGLVLLEVAVLAQAGLEVALVAELGDDVAIAVAGEDLVALEDVGVAQLLQHVDLREQQFLQLLALQRLQLHDLDRHDFVCISHPLLEISWCAR